MMYYYHWNKEHQTHNIINDNMECVFYSNTIEGLDAWIDNQVTQGMVVHSFNTFEKGE